MYTPDQDISKFFIAGINYKKTDASIRGEYAVSQEEYEAILSASPAFGIHELFILSTCNRTEIYGFAPDAFQLMQLLCGQTKGNMEVFMSKAYIKNGVDALEHLFDVGAGLDSQILGDYEIVGQLKQAVKFAKERSRIGSFTERLVNAVLQSSKTIKNQTALSGGTVSVSFSAIQYIRQKIKQIGQKKILLVGVGKIGSNTCKNLVDYLHTRNITLINRTPEKAAALAEELGLQYAPYEELSRQTRAADIILVATNAPTPTIVKADLENQGPKLIIDLSIPYNVETAAQQLNNVTLVNVDELSKLKDSTLHKRKAEVPKAKEIIKTHIHDFLAWYEMRKYVPVLKAVKSKLQEMHEDPLFLKNTHHIFAHPSLQEHDQERIQKVINGMAIKMRRRNQGGCHYIEAINEYITPRIN
ncbi:MAG TPA: glutamyl-tRNA reductase [Flavitalea sp.]|nr:glutamyl-tRNA reductase [Flavitalea sp.]